MTQSLSFTHPQVAEDVMQTGVACCVTQRESLTDEHTPHSPASALPGGWQAGSVLVGQESGPGLVVE